MNSWRIQTIFDNRSQRSLPSAGSGLGATVVRSTRGPKEPMFFSQGETTRLLNIFGAPSTSNPELLEAIEYNKSYPIWISSPSNRGKSSAIVFGPSGSEQVLAGLDLESSVDLSELHLFTKLQGIIAEGAVTFGGTLGLPDEIVLDGEDQIVTFKLLINGEEETVIVAGSEGIYTISGDILTSGTLILGTGEIVLVFSEGVEESDLVEIEYKVNLSSYYGLIALKGPADSDYMRAKIVATEISDANAFELHTKIKNLKGQYVDMINSPFIFSLDPDHEDGYGKNIFIENVFRDSDFFVPFIEGAASFTSDSTFVDDSTFLAFSGGYRGGEFGDFELSDGYEYFKQTRKYPIDIFFDATQNTSIPTLFSTLRENYHKYSRFILPVPLMNVTEALSWTMPVSNRGIYFYYGYFYLRNIYHSSGRVIGIPIGEVAKKHADIMLLAFGGIAPAWFDENGMGGQLTSGRVIEAIYDPDESQLRLLDEARINPIIYDLGVGPMVVSRRTSVSGSLSDWSFIDYSGAMDYILKNITSQVLPYQIVKLNDASHRNIIRSKANSILQPMTVPPVNVVREFAVKCDSQNNNDEVLEREEFRLDVAVKFTPKSRTIILTFINTPQGATVEEMFE